MSVNAGVGDDAMIAIRDKLRGKIGQTKVKRYWPGKVPEWAELEDVDEDGDICMNKTRHHDLNIVGKDDRRLRRLAKSRVANRDGIRAECRRIRQAEIVSTIEEENIVQDLLDLVDEDEEALQEKRRRTRERILLQQKQEAENLEEEDEVQEDEDEGEESSEYETDSDNDEQPCIVTVKPIFVHKSERDSILERKRIEQEELGLEELEKKRLAERKAETKKLLVEEINKGRIIQKNLESEANINADVDTDDEVNQAEEYEAWKVRELARVKRDRENREALLKQREETKRLRNMTDGKRKEFDRKNPKPSSNSTKRKWTFMQIFFHKGSYFQSGDDEDIYKRDFSAPTGEDKMDKTLLPKVMQVKHFGRRGRTKWTHLVNEDTTYQRNWKNP